MYKELKQYAWTLYSGLADGTVTMTDLVKNAYDYPESSIPNVSSELHSASERVEEAETFEEAVYAAIEYEFWLEITLTLPYTAYLLLTGQIPENGKTCRNMVL